MRIITARHIAIRMNSLSLLLFLFSLLFCFCLAFEGVCILFLCNGIFAERIFEERAREKKLYSYILYYYFFYQLCYDVDYVDRATCYNSYVLGIQSVKTIDKIVSIIFYRP